MNTKIHFLFLFLVVFCLYSNGQTPVTVNSTGGVVTTASYPDLKAAFDTINSGYQTGAIEIIITGNVTQTVTAKLDSSGRVQPWGTSSYTSIVMYPLGGTFTISGAITAGNALIHLNGADNVTINGVNNGTDSLVISNTTASATSGTCTILLSNDATNNNIRKTTILGAATMSTTTNGGTLFISTAVSGGSGNDNNTISNCLFANNNATNTSFPYKHIYINGTTANATIANSGIVIDSNRFVNFRANGVYSNTGVRDLTVSNNHFYHIATLASSSVAFAPVFVSNATVGIGENFRIYRNYIGGTAPFCGGTKPSITLSTVFQTIYLNCATTASSFIDGNTISNINITTSSTTTNHSFIYINGGKVSCGSLEGNLIGSMSDTGSLVMVYSGSSSTTFAVFCSAGSNTTPTYDSLVFENNKFGGFTLRGSTGVSGQNSSLRIFDPTGSTGTFVIRNNTLGSPTVPNSIKQYTTGNSLIGIISRSTSAQQHVLKGNYFGNLTHFGTGTGSNTTVISLSNASSWISDSNMVENITSYTASVGVDESSSLIAIAFRPNGSLINSLAGNRVRNIIFAHPTAKTNIIGISAGGTAGSNIISGNRVHNLYSLSSDTSTIVGMRLNFGATGSISIQNNEISLGLDSAGNSITSGHTIYGMVRVRGNTNVYHNSVYIGGSSVSNAASTYALFTTDTGGTRVFRNNVFSNERSFSSLLLTKNAAAFLAGTPVSGAIAGLNCDYNLYYAPNVGGVLITNSGNDYPSLISWAGVAYMQDGSSTNGNPLFLLPTQLQGQSGTAITGGDPSVGVITDILGNTRTSFYRGAYDGLSPIPVRYLSSRAFTKGNDVRVEWSTASESNNKGFVVERSYDGSVYSDVAFIKGVGQASTVHNYEWTDLKVWTDYSGGKLYYRLRQIDFNGMEEHSPVMVVNATVNQSELSVYPNPFEDELRINIGLYSIPQRVVVTDLNGQVLFDKWIEQDAGQQTLTLRLPAEIRDGMYFVHTQFENESKVFKVFKVGSTKGDVSE